VYCYTGVVMYQLPGILSAPQINQSINQSRGWHTVIHCRDICDHSQSISQRSRSMKSYQFNGKQVKASSPQWKLNYYEISLLNQWLKVKKGLLFKGQSKISAGQGYDRGHRLGDTSFLLRFLKIWWAIYSNLIDSNTDSSLF